jgi:hypothetical protein
MFKLRSSAESQLDDFVDRVDELRLLKVPPLMRDGHLLSVDDGVVRASETDFKNAQYS